MIVWLASYPRSGNTFFRIILKHAFSQKTFSVYDDPMLDKLGISGTVGHEHLPDSLDALRESKEIYFVKTHECASDDSPAIFLIRDGRDALVSHTKYQLSFRGKQSIFASRRRRDLEHTLEKLIHTKPQFGGWSKNANSWVDRPDARTAVVSFEALIASPQQEAEKALAHLGIDLSRAVGSEIPNFAALQQQSAEFFRKGKVGSWRDEMPPHLHELFWQHHGATMERFGYGSAEANSVCSGISSSFAPAAFLSSPAYLVALASMT